MPEVDHSDDWIIFLTTVVSHASMLLPIWQFHQRRWTYELFVAIFTLMTSFMYHFCQAFHAEIYLTELKWHRLDNICSLTCFGMFFVHISCIRNPLVDQVLRIATFLFSVLMQEKAPWDINYTAGPILLFLLCPVIVHGFIHRELPPWDYRECVIGFGLLGLAIFFFILGLDDDNDRYRIFHGLWHFFVGFASLHNWRIVKTHPQHPSGFGAGISVGRPE
jgi:hypothetical protein